MASLTETEFLSVSRPELEALTRALDALGDEVEAELADDILTVEFEDGSEAVVNRHGAARQIWMAAQRTAWHFDWQPTSQTWVAQKNGDELWQALSRVVSQKLGRSVTLVR